MRGLECDGFGGDGLGGDGLGGDGLGGDDCRRILLLHRRQGSARKAVGVFSFDLEKLMGRERRRCVREGDRGSVQARDGWSRQVLKKLDVWSQHAHRLTAVHRNTRPWYCTSTPLRVLSSTLESYTGKISVLSFPLEY